MTAIDDGLPFRWIDGALRQRNPLDEGPELPPPDYEGEPAFDLVDFLARAFAFSVPTFGPGPRAAGVVKHIRSELEEIEREPDDLEEWVDVMLLAFDGAMRQGHPPAAIAAALEAKLAKNKARRWPDWRTVPEGEPVEHVREVQP